MAKPEQSRKATDSIRLTNGCKRLQMTTHRIGEECLSFASSTVGKPASVKSTQTQES